MRYSKLCWYQCVCMSRSSRKAMIHFPMNPNLILYHEGDRARRKVPFAQNVGVYFVSFKATTAGNTRVIVQTEAKYWIKMKYSQKAEVWVFIN